MKIFTYLIHDTKEYYAKKRLKDLRKYLFTWHLNHSEIDILFETGVYNHENLGIIEFNVLDI